MQDDRTRFEQGDGIAVSAIDSMGVGEADLAVATGQDVRNSSNRRATMVIAGQ